MKKKFSGKRPVMFYQPGRKDHNDDLVYGQRIRIFYPDGKIEWGTFWEPYKGCSSNYWFKEDACFLQKVQYDPITNERSFYYLEPENIQEAIELAEDYDKRMLFPKMKFLGEL